MVLCFLSIPMPDKYLLAVGPITTITNYRISLSYCIIAVQEYLKLPVKIYERICWEISLLPASNIIYSARICKSLANVLHGI